ncbi:MAG: NAD-dependent epimerase/dehydratase family protein, partial [Ruthenibacterium sp.]
STNKVYGDLDAYTYEETPTRYICKEFPRGFDESVPLDFRSPYGCSKGAADQYMLDFARMFGVRATVFRHSSMYGSRQFATCDQGWIGWFCAKAIEKFQTPACPPFTISGNGKQVRDILHAEDMISLYYTALEHVDQVFGQAYNIGGGMEQSLSLLELFQMLNKLLDVKLAYTQQAPRQSDQKVFVADIAKINKAIGWQPRVTALAGISKMVDWVRGIV